MRPCRTLLQNLHLAPYTLHTLHPTPYTLNPTPYTLEPQSGTLHAEFSYLLYVVCFSGRDEALQDIATVPLKAPIQAASHFARSEVAGVEESGCRG